MHCDLAASTHKVRKQVKTPGDAESLEVKDEDIGSDCRWHRLITKANLGK
jgi:hypothetical protein